MNAPEHFDLDLGDGHWLEWCSWSPDRSIPANAERYAGIPDIPRLGAIIYHLSSKSESGMCAGAVNFDTPEVAKVIPSGRHRWQVQSWEPLTLSPSIKCLSCGDHGFIRNGKWVRA